MHDNLYNFQFHLSILSIIIINVKYPQSPISHLLPSIFSFHFNFSNFLLSHAPLTLLSNFFHGAPSTPLSPISLLRLSTHLLHHLPKSSVRYDRIGTLAQRCCYSDVTSISRPHCVSTAILSSQGINIPVYFRLALISDKNVNRTLTRQDTLRRPVTQFRT